MSAPTYTIGERVVFVSNTTGIADQMATVIEAPPGRVCHHDSVWIELDRPLFGRKTMEPLVERVRRYEAARLERHTERVAKHAPDFAPLLREYRDRRRLSQSRLAEAAGFDHSYISRIESGTRLPTREAVAKLADAMGLDEGERDALLASAGFMPGRIENLFASEPVLSEVLGLLQDRAVPAEVRDDVRHIISLLVRQAQRMGKQEALHG